MALPSLLLLALGLGVLGTAHAALLFGLLFRRPRWRALAALLIPPLAPYFGWEARLRVWCVLWLVGLVVYLLFRVLASF